MGRRLDEKMQDITAFVDESGDTSLKIQKEGVSSLYVCTAVVIENSAIDQANKTITEWKDKFNGGSELKSNKIGRKHKRRLMLLKALEQVPFNFYANITDKAQIIKGSGLSYKEVFFKFINDKLYQRLMLGTDSLHIIADEHGKKAFMEGCKIYFRKKAQPDLYKTWNHDFEDSAVAPLIQVADIIAGTLAWCFDPTKDCGDYRDKFLETLQKKELGIDFWPRRKEQIPELHIGAKSEWDEVVRAVCHNATVSFIEKFSGDTNGERQMQVAIAQLLLYLNSYEVADEKARYSDNLIKHLTLQGFEPISKRKFGHSIIGPLRDSGVIIAGDASGYRLAMSVDDINRYVRHVRTIVEPMLNRLLKARRILKTNTLNKFDMLANERFNLIRELVKTFGDADLKYALTSSAVDKEELRENA